MSKHSLQHIAGVALFACGLALAGPAFAADQPAAATTAPAKVQKADPVESRITEIHQRLHVTAEQEPSFGALAQVMRDNRKSHEEGFREMEKARETITAVDDLKVYAQMAQIHADGLKKLSDSFEAFYQTLSDDQKKQADTMFRDYKRMMSAGPHHRSHDAKAKPSSER